jgi:hypothetical protein
MNLGRSVFLFAFRLRLGSSTDCIRGRMRRWLLIPGTVHGKSVAASDVDIDHLEWPENEPLHRRIEKHVHLRV